MSVNSFNPTLVIFKADFHPNTGADINLADINLTHEFLNTFF